MKKDNCKDKNACEHIIGFYYGYDEENIVSLEMMKQIVSRDRLYGDCEETFSDFADNGIYRCFDRFEFCPRCGQRIDWERLKKENGNDK